MMKNERPAKLCPIPQKGASITPPLSSKRNIMDFQMPAQAAPEKPIPKQRNTTGAQPFVLNNLRQDPSLIIPHSSSKDKTLASFDRGGMRQRGSLNPITNQIPLLQPRGGNGGLRPSVQTQSQVHPQSGRDAGNLYTGPPVGFAKSQVNLSQNNSQLLGKSADKLSERLKEQLQVQLIQQPAKFDSRRKVPRSEAIQKSDVMQKSDSKLQLTVQSIETPRLSPNSRTAPGADASPHLTPAGKSGRNRSYFLTNNSNAGGPTNIYDKSARASKVSSELASELKAGGAREPVSGG